MSPTEHKDHIVVLGLGHVGLTLGLALADVGYTVAGYDIKEDVREATRVKTPHFKEKGLAELLEKHVGKSFRVVDVLERQTTPSVYIITVGTPFHHDNTPNYNYIKSAADMIRVVLAKGDAVILRSTIPLGTTRDVVKVILERSGLTAGTDFDLAFAPERTVEGNAFEELRTLPQILGGYDAQSLARAHSIFAPLCTTLVPLDSLEEAEMVKLVNNTYRETVFAFANQVSLLARAWGLDTKKVIAAANEGYARSRVPFPSPGVGGYCLTKDGFLFKASAQKKHADTRLLSAVHENTSTVLDVMARDLRAFAREHFGRRRVRLGVLGFAFKGMPETSDVRGSMTFSLNKRFTGERIDIVGFDPQVEPSVIREMLAEPLPSIREVIAGSDMVVIMNNNPAFSAVTPALFPPRAEKYLLFDTWGVCAKEDFTQHPAIEYWTL